jgi:chromosomal replication initiator protein
VSPYLGTSRQSRTEPDLTNGVVTLSLAKACAADRSTPANGAQREFFAGPENRLAAGTIEHLLSLLRNGPVGNALRSDPLPTDGSSRNATEGVPYRNGFPSALSSPSPIVFHGAPGTGKSHLLHGLFQEWKRRRPADKVVLITAAEFAQQFADAVEKRSVTPWRVRFRTADLLGLEDLLHLASKPAAQAELRHTLDELADAGRVAVITSRLAPHDLTNFLPGLRSRLQAGLCVPLAVPEIEARRAILSALCLARQLSLSDGSLRLLARSLAAPAPELSGTLANIELAARSSGRTLDDKFVQGYIAQHCTARHPPLRTIATHTARYFALRVSELRSASRRRGVVLARDVAMYLSRQLTAKSLKQIGDYFGGRDHTTVLHGCRKTETLMRSDAVTLEAVTSLRQALATG